MVVPIRYHLHSRNPPQITSKSLQMKVPRLIL
nr:MAG TPA: hypothetical protein [Caudoviricetes sp.]